MKCNLADYSRFTYNTIPIYVNPSPPDWFIPMHAADTVLSQSDQVTNYHSAALYKSIERRVADTYKGRAAYRTLSLLKECWVSLKATASLSVKYLAVALPAVDELSCIDYTIMKECAGVACPLFHGRDVAASVRTKDVT